MVVHKRCPYKIAKNWPLSPKNIRTGSTPLSVWTHHRFRKIRRFLHQKVRTSSSEEPPRKISSLDYPLPSDCWCRTDSYKHLIQNSDRGTRGCRRTFNVNSIVSSCLLKKTKRSCTNIATCFSRCTTSQRCGVEATP